MFLHAKKTVITLFLFIQFFSLSVQADYAEHSEQLATEMLSTIEAFLATVAGPPGRIEQVIGYDRGELTSLEFNDDARTNYVYWPYLRKGLPLDFMSAQQRMIVHDLLNTALSAKGYLSAVQIMQMEETLADLEVIGFPRGTENYTLTIFGEPSADSEWGWRFEGHHLSLNFTLSPNGISVTPAFFGASPAQHQNGNLAGFRNLRPMHEAGRSLILALSPQQQEEAIETGNPPSDILAGNLNRPQEQWNDWKDLDSTGIALNSLNAMQKDLAQTIIDEVVTIYQPEISLAYLAQVDVNALRFTWIGSTEAGAPHYYRLDGPDFFFEYDLVQGNGNHVHAVWRSKDGDFGEDLLREHRNASH